MDYYRYQVLKVFFDEGIWKLCDRKEEFVALLTNAESFIAWMVLWNSKQLQNYLGITLKAI